jgi:(heptosyl)LPS beta-1,4-glucosyltransferase
MGSAIKLSAVVIAQNSEAIIEQCLKSLQFADEIVVIDAASYDDTPKIARRYGARVMAPRAGSRIVSITTRTPHSRKACLG